MPGNYKVTINDTSVDVSVGPDGNGNASIYLPAGKGYLVNTSFADSENYTIFITPAVFDINKADNNIVVSVESVEYPDVVVVKVTADVDGIYKVNVSGKVYEIEANGTSGPINLAAGDYWANVTDYISDTYEGIITNASFTVNKKANDVKVIVEDTVLPDAVIVNVTADVDGVYTVSIGDINLDVNVIDGIGSNSTSLAAGKGYLANTSFADTENYTVSITLATFDVNKGTNNFKIEIDDLVYHGTAVVNVTADVDGEYTIQIADKNITVNVVDGKGSNTTALSQGVYTTSTIYASDISTDT